jgi:hypothetical protein
MELLKYVRSDDEALVEALWRRREEDEMLKESLEHLRDRSKIRERSETTDET